MSIPIRPDRIDARRELLTIDQTVQRMGVTRRTVYNWLKAGKLDTVRTPGGNVRIYADSLLIPDNTAPQAQP